ncbi:MAG: N-acetylmuramoyl-L-alanine amidase [Acidimicrobiales bacterium]
MPSSRRHPTLAALMVSGLLTAGCTAVSATDEPAVDNNGVGTTIGDEIADDQAASSTTVATVDEEPEPERPAIVTPGDARALITPTGVVVPVAGFSDAGYAIMTPCGNDGIVSWGTPLNDIQIVLDPGHGGDVETGAQGPNGLVERDLNLAVAKRTANLLGQRQISVVLTRTANYRVPLAVRAEIANRLEAAAIVSIHHNAPEGVPSPTPGTEVFVQKDVEESRRLGGTIYEAVVDALEPFDVAWQTAPDAGVLEVLNNEGEDTYGMVRRPEMPGVLVELGYLANPAEAELFATDEYVEVASLALADGIEAWLLSDAEGTGFVAEPRIFIPTSGTGGAGGCVDPALE